MTEYAKVISGAVTGTGALPQAATRLDAGQAVSNFQQADQTLREACGWFPIVEVRPALGQDQVYGAPTFQVNAHDVTATYPVVADSDVNIAGRAQDTAVVTLLAGATALRTRLAGYQADLVSTKTTADAAAATFTTAATTMASAATTFAAAASTYQTALTGLSGSATAAQIVTFLKGSQGTFFTAIVTFFTVWNTYRAALNTYLTADRTADTAIGIDLNSTITELDNVVKGLGNLIAKQSGSTTVFS